MRWWWPFTRSAERKGLGLSDFPWLAAGAVTQSGVTVSVETALKVPAVSCAILGLAGAASSLPASVTVNSKPDTAHPVARLIAGGPNGWTSWSDFVQEIMIDALCYDGGATAWVNRPSSKPVEIILWRRSVLTAEQQDDRSFSYRLYNRPVPADDVIHLKGPFGLAPLTLAREAIGTAKALEQHVGRILSGGGRPSGVLKTANSIRDKEVLQRLKESWQAAHAGQFAGKTAILEGGFEFQALGFKLVDLEYNALQIFQIGEIARAFRVPPGMLYEMSRQTWANMEQASREFLVNSLEPWLKALEGALNRALFSPDERATHRVVFDRDDMSRADLTARATAISSLIAARVLNANEGRDWLGLPPRAGGEVFENPNINPEASNAAA